MAGQVHVLVVDDNSCSQVGHGELLNQKKKPHQSRRTVGIYEQIMS